MDEKPRLSNNLLETYEKTVLKIFEFAEKYSSDCNFLINKDLKQVFDFIKDNLEFDQLIWEFGSKNNPDWVHVSYESTGRQRKQVLRAVKTNGTTKYENY